jgi:uncharacterized protein (TIRG00374 family)
LPVAAALITVVLQFLVLASRWRMLLPVDSEGQRVPLRTVAEALLVGILANAALPARLGEVARTVAIARRGAVDVAGSAGTVVLERVLDLSVLASAALLAAWVAGAPWLPSQSLAIVTVSGIAAIVLLMSGAFPRLIVRLPERILDRSRQHATLRWLARLVHGVHAGRRPQLLVVGLVATATSVLLDGVIVWLVGFALGLPLTWAEALLLATAGVLVTAVPSAPANIGTYEFAVSWVATSLGIPAEAGLALAVVTHVIIVLPLALAGAAVVLLSLRADPIRAREFGAAGTTSRIGTLRGELRASDRSRSGNQR